MPVNRVVVEEMACLLVDFARTVLIAPQMLGELSVGLKLEGQAEKLRITNSFSYIDHGPSLEIFRR